MELQFEKYHGAGNDFVMVDARTEGPGKSLIGNPGGIAALANRPDGVGCEGVIFVENTSKPGCDFRMRFFNPDGSEAELCGNGARCVSAFAYRIGAVSSPRMRFETLAGDIEAEVLDSELVRIAMPTPKDLRPNFVNSGVPHAIVPVKDLPAADVAGEGRRIRYSDAFAPAGTNVDFVEYTAPSRVDIRTYERGVEAETFACGTGSVAAAVVGVAQYGLVFPVKVVTARGVTLEIGGEFREGAFVDVTLTGPVKKVFVGVIDV